LDDTIVLFSAFFELKRTYAIAATYMMEYTTLHATLGEITVLLVFLVPNWISNAQFLGGNLGTVNVFFFFSQCIYLLHFVWFFKVYNFYNYLRIKYSFIESIRCLCMYFILSISEDEAARAHDVAAKCRKRHRDACRCEKHADKEVVDRLVCPAPATAASVANPEFYG